MKTKTSMLGRGPRRFALMLAVLFAFVLAVAGTGVALAHESRAVGKYKFMVGFLNEPALLNEPNSLDFRVTVSDTAKPVEGLDKTVKADIIFGGSTLPLELSARFGQPGAYNAFFIPTRAGTYIFHFTGQIEGTNIDEKFESGPGRFNDVTDTSTIQFPVKVPAPADMIAQLKSAQDAAASAQSAAVGAQALAYIGIAVGVVGLIVGGLGFMRRK
jgi:hypothetical protein